MLRVAVGDPLLPPLGARISPRVLDQIRHVLGCAARGQRAHPAAGVGLRIGGDDGQDTGSLAHVDELKGPPASLEARAPRGRDGGAQPRRPRPALPEVVRCVGEAAALPDRAHACRLHSLHRRGEHRQGAEPRPRAGLQEDVVDRGGPRLRQAHGHLTAALDAQVVAPC